MLKKSQNVKNSLFFSSTIYLWVYIFLYIIGMKWNFECVMSKKWSFHCKKWKLTVVIERKRKILTFKLLAATKDDTISQLITFQGTAKQGNVLLNDEKYLTFDATQEKRTQKVKISFDDKPKELNGKKFRFSIKHQISFKPYETFSSPV